MPMAQHTWQNFPVYHKANEMQQLLFHQVLKEKYE